jgi:hypothetical protein
MNVVCGAIGLFKSIFNIGIVDDKVQAHRISCCWSCPHMIMKSQRCKICGCYLKHKTRLDSQSCPKDKW